MPRRKSTANIRIVQRYFYALKPVEELGLLQNLTSLSFFVLNDVCSRVLRMEGFILENNISH